MKYLRTSSLLLAVVCGVLFGHPCRSVAKTWLVEKDGSGEFLVIQDAVNAAASGDTVRIGPGRFDDKVYAVSVGWSDSVRILVTQHELTIVGSGPETIIGQALPWTLEQGQHKGIVASDFWGNAIIRISNLRFENMRDAIYTSHEDISQNNIDISNCTFHQNLYSLALIGNGGVVKVSDCFFNFMPLSASHLIAWNHGRVEINRCSFSLLSNGLWSQRSVSLINVSNATLDNCSFLRGSIGLVAGLGGAVIVRNCLFDGQSNVAFSAEVMSDISVEDCTFRNQTRALSSSSSDSRVSLIDSVVEDVSDCTILMSYFGSLSVSNCDLAAGERGVVYILDIPNCNTAKHFDMTGNYWGTSDVDSVSSLIRDRNDSDQVCYFIDYEPLLPVSVPNQKASWGGFKALFR